MLKQYIRKKLTEKAHADYDRRVRHVRFYYDDFVNEFEKKETGFPEHEKMLRIFYDQISSKILTQMEDLPDDTPVIFACRRGRILECADSWFGHFFATHENVQLAYADEDEVSESGYLSNPYLKPDWSPDSYENAFYIGSIFAARTGIVRKAIYEIESGRGFYGAEGTKVIAADRLFGTIAKLCKGFEKREKMDFPIGHVDEILFHRDSKESLFYGRPFHKQYHKLEKNHVVSIVIPSKDHPDILGQCINSLIDISQKSSQLKIEIIVVDNGSSDNNKTKIEEMLQTSRERGISKINLINIEYLYQKMDFNFSKMCNLGADKSQGDMVLFLNDDIEIVDSMWLTELVYQAEKSYVGAVGAKLLYPEKNLIQHAGITNIHLGPMHKLQRLDDSKEYYFRMNRGIHDMAGVTAACILMTKEHFVEAGKYDENMAVAFNDVDLNYRLLKKGYYNVCCNHISLFHHESLSRGDDNQDAAKLERMLKENDILFGKHADMYDRDPFYHKYLDGRRVHPEYEILAYEKTVPADHLGVSMPEIVKNGYPAQWKNDCVWVRVEYKGTLKKWNRLYYTGKNKNKEKSSEGYLVSGYSFVIGSDNSIYKRKLVLKRVKSGTDFTPVEKKVYSFDVNDDLREDIRKNISDQVNVELTGYRVRIAQKALPAGYYQIGMVYFDKTGRTRVMNWEEKAISVG